MGDEEAATLDGQYHEYSRLFDNKRSGTTITLYRSDFWMRQAKLLDDRKVTMTDTGTLFNKYRQYPAQSITCPPGSMMVHQDSKLVQLTVGIRLCDQHYLGFAFSHIPPQNMQGPSPKSELSFEEWIDFLTDLCELKELDEAKVKEALTNCGLPGQVPVMVPQYRDYFLTYKPKEKFMP